MREISQHLPWRFGDIDYIRIYYWETGGPEIRYVQIWRWGDDWDHPLCVSPGGSDNILDIGKDQWHEWLDDVRARSRR